MIMHDVVVVVMVRKDVDQGEAFEHPIVKLSRRIEVAPRVKIKGDVQIPVSWRRHHHGAVCTMDLEGVFKLLETATLLEKKGQRIEAATKYYESCYLMRQVLSRFPQDQKSSPIYHLLQEKIKFYSHAAQNLYFDDNSVARGHTSTPSTVIVNDYQSDDVSVLTPPIITFPMTPETSQRSETSDTKRFTQSAEINRRASLANASLERAIDLDENNRTKDAIVSYMSAAEIYLQAIKLAEMSSTSSSIALVMKRRLISALDRVETLKNPPRNQQLNDSLGKKTTNASVSNISTSSSLSKEEIEVLKRSSLIASGLFLPFSEEDAGLLSRQVAITRNANCKLWTDPKGTLPLSEKQKKRFHKWARPAEIVQQRSRMGVKQRPPVLISSINPYHIQQQYVTDCSFIASLCICALFEKRFGKRLITSIVYPQDENGIPMYNPAGKYMVKLWLNGVARCVEVDDRLPVDRHSNLLCSQTSNDRNQLELFCSIIEKAYMKLCGGYDFPGSNSGVDLFSLTGWIPERIFFPSHVATGKRIRDFETPPDRAWDRLYSANSFGDCLITVSTTCDMTEEKANSLGLVTGHAYAVLDVFQSQNGIKLLQLKNPWACKSWSGKYSPQDTKSWQDSYLRSELRYDPTEAAKHDNGVFWISWEDILLYFRNLQLSWNPKLFSYRLTTHGFWPVNQGPKIDAFNVGENPQYIMALSDKAVSKKATIWVLISRHVTKQEQEGAEVNEFLTIHLVRNSARLERVWYPHGKATIVNGCYTNNPHVLLRYDVTGPEDQFISLVLSQHEKKKDLSYTLSCYSTEYFTIKRPPKMLPCKLKFAGQWTKASAGGAFGRKGFFQNPIFKLSVREKARMQIQCTASDTLAINIMFLYVGDNSAIEHGTLKQLLNYNKKPVLDSGNYRHGFTTTETKLVNPGIYVAIASTYDAGQLGRFNVTIHSSIDITVSELL